MFKRITTKEDFIENPILEMNIQEIENSQTDDIILYDKTFRMYSDEWKHHVHIKCTDRCDSNCNFCIEKSERNNPQNENNLITSTKDLLEQLSRQGQLKTVSITGGEPTVFKRIGDLIDIIGSFDLLLFSINTNGRNLEVIPRDFKGWLDISKHAVDDREVFKRDYNIDCSKLKLFKETHPNTSIRFQCVLGVSNEMKTIQDILNYIETFRLYVDDFSFRNLIINNDEGKIDDLLLEFRKLLFESGGFVEQVIQDYYVYEVYNFLGTTVTLSWSNMKELKNYNETHSSNFLEEIIVHPDGMITGSWNKKSLIIHRPVNTEDNTYIECRGINCKNHCKRYIGNKFKESFKFKIYSCEVEGCFDGGIDQCGVDSCFESRVDHCGIDSCD